MGADRAQSLWDFSLAHYGMDGVAAAVIRLQEVRGADVNLLFYCCWCAADGRGALSAEDLAAADAAVVEWRELVTRPLRRVRDAIKADSKLSGLPEAMETRRKVLAAEVDSERVAQRVMLSAAPPAERADATPSADAAASLLTYFGQLGATLDDEDRAALVTLLVAVFPRINAEDVRAALAEVRRSPGDDGFRDSR